jgi:hypothetical protein
LNFHTPIIPVLPQHFQLFDRTIADDLRRRDAGAWPSVVTETQLPDDAGDYRQDDYQQADLNHAVTMRLSPSVFLLKQSESGNGN